MSKRKSKPKPEKLPSGNQCVRCKAIVAPAIWGGVKKQHKTVCQFCA